MSSRSTRSGGIAKSVPAVIGGGVRKKNGPVKAGFTPPAHTRVTQVAPGVLLSDEVAVATRTAPIAISIPQTTTGARFRPGHNNHHHHNLSISSIGSVVSNGPMSPSSVSARSPISTSFGLSGLEVLASLSLGQAASMSPGQSHLALSPSAGSIPLAGGGGTSYTYARGGSVAPSNSGSAGNTSFSISSSLPQSSVRSGSGDSDELPEVDEDDGDEMEISGGQRKHDEEWEDGVDFQMDM